ncbi:hypothetical protein BDV96DRAFT_653368 [Lophiotrema nucula]|uniref:Mid2 domain-containing protein n=1 Tax=Lophiotrema nucula TaxID=690887 RepID=A0A6A5YLA4_9PLEO|nr:hypothetical protein BDV96DRAFT_653368 [Lophiotrema nucula]
MGDFCVSTTVSGNGETPVATVICPGGLGPELPVTLSQQTSIVTFSSQPQTQVFTSFMTQPQTKVLTSIITPSSQTPSIIFATSVSSTTTVHTSATPEAASPLSSTPSHPRSSNTGLMAGAKAGIAIGAILGVAIVALVAFLLGKRLTKKALQNQGDNANAYEKAELDGREVDRSSKRGGFVGVEAQELPGHDMRAELEGSRPARSS